MKALKVTRPSISGKHYYIKTSDDLVNLYTTGEIEDVLCGEIGDKVCFELVELPEETLEASEEFSGW